MFDHLLKQTLILRKKNGKTIKGINASVQEVIFVNDIKLPIEEGDHFEYVLPSGVKQNLLITKVTLYNQGSSLDHYEIDYVKD